VPLECDTYIRSFQLILLLKISDQEDSSGAPVRPISLSRSGGVNISYPIIDELNPGAYSSIMLKHLWANDSYNNNFLLITNMKYVMHKNATRMDPELCE